MTQTAGIVLLLLSALALSKSTSYVIGVFRHLAVELKLAPFGLASLLLAFSTSLPELMVGISATVQGDGDLALGNLIGSNIANLSLILGGAAMISGNLRATDAFLKREVIYVFLAGSFPMLLLLDKNLTRFDGLVLIAIYILFNVAVLTRKRKEMISLSAEAVTWWQRWLVRVTKPRVEKNMVKLALGIAAVIVAADVMVKAAKYLAESMGVPDLVVGLILVAVGTSLPEMMLEIKAIKAREVQMAFGNILGSVVANATGILGLIALIKPIKLANGLQPYLTATIAFVIVFFVFWLLVRTKHRLDRWEGGLLALIYLVFAWIEWQF